ncbi:hypothetical protein Ancab_007882 [Ancistrocladus abbreviatus]
MSNLAFAQVSTLDPDEQDYELDRNKSVQAAAKAGEPPFASLAQFTAVRVHCRRSPPEEAHRRGLAQFQKGGGLSTQFAAGGGPLPVSTSKHCCRFGRFPAIFYEFRRFFAKFSSFPSDREWIGAVIMRS